MPFAMARSRACRTAETQAGGSYEDPDLVFATAKGTPLDAQNGVNRHFKPLLRRTGLPDIRWHDLRHSYFTLLLRRGCIPNSSSTPRGTQHTAHARPLLALDAEHGRAHCKRHGPCEVLRRWMAGGFDLVASPRQLHELQTVLAREKFRRYLTYEDATEYVSWLHHGAEVVRDPGENVVRGAVEADPDDEYLVGLTETLGGGDPPTSCPSVFTGAPFQPGHASLELTSGFRNTSGSAAKGRIRPD